MNFITLHVAKIKKLPIVWAVIVLVFLVNGYSSLNASSEDVGRAKTWTYLGNFFSGTSSAAASPVFTEDDDLSAGDYDSSAGGDASSAKTKESTKDDKIEFTAFHEAYAEVHKAVSGLLFPTVEFDENHTEGQAARLIKNAGLKPDEYFEGKNGLILRQWTPPTIAANLINDFTSSVHGSYTLEKNKKAQMKLIGETYKAVFEKLAYEALNNDILSLQDLIESTTNSRAKSVLQSLLDNAKSVAVQLRKAQAQELAKSIFDVVRPTGGQFNSLQLSLSEINDELRNVDTLLQKEALQAVKARLTKIDSGVKRFKSLAEGDLREAIKQAANAGSRPSILGKSDAQDDKDEIVAVLQKEFKAENKINQKSKDLEGAVAKILSSIKREGSDARQLIALQKKFKELQVFFRSLNKKDKNFDKKQQEINSYQEAIEIVQDRIQEARGKIKSVDARIADLVESHDGSIVGALAEWEGIPAEDQEDIYNEVLGKLQQMQAKELQDSDEVGKIVEAAKKARPNDPAKQVIFLQGELKLLQGQLRTVSKTSGALKKHQDKIKYHEMAIEQLQDEIQGLRGDSKLIEERIADLIENHGGSIEAAFEEMNAIKYKDILDEKVLEKLTIMHNKEAAEINAIHDIVNKAMKAAGDDPVLALEKVRADLKKEESALIKLKGALKKNPLEIKEKQDLVNRTQRAIDELQNKIAEHQDEQQQVEQAVQALLKKNDDDIEAALKEIDSKRGAAMSDFDQKVQQQLIKQQTRTAQEDALYKVQSQQAEEMIVAAQYPMNAMNEAEDHLTELQESLVEAQKIRSNAAVVNKIKKEIEEHQKVMVLIPSKVKLVMKQLDEFWKSQDLQKVLIDGLKRFNNNIEKVSLELFGQYKTFVGNKKARVRVAFNLAKLDEAIEKQIKQQVTQFVEDLKEAKKNDPVEKALAQLKAGDISVANLDTVVEGQLAQMGVKIDALNKETRDQLGAIVGETAERLVKIMESKTLTIAQQQMQKQIIMKGMLKETGYLIAGYHTGASQQALATGNLQTIATDMALRRFINYLTPSQEE